MAVVTSTFNTSVATNWTSSTWVSTDPSWKLNTQLTNWITAINDVNIIEKVQDPGNATTRASTAYVQWLLRARENDTSSDYGILFHRRQGAQSATNDSKQTYYNRSVSTSDNNYGTYSSTGASVSNETFSSGGWNFFTAYEAVGTTPWFVYSAENVAKTERHQRCLFRYDNSGVVAGSYVPTNIGKWIYMFNGAMRIPINSIAAPYKGFGDGGSNYLFRSPVPQATPNGDGYFFRASTQYGGNHAAGTITTDLLISNSTTGVWGDTTAIDGVTYTCIGTGSISTANYWIKSS